MKPSPPLVATGPGGRYRLLETIPFVAVHLGCLAAVWTVVNATDLIVAAGLYALRMFAVTAGYHRYFAHRGFKTGRAFAFVLAFLAQTSAQRGVLWWAGNHRQHHRFSDTDRDVHSPVRRGCWHAHLGWFFTDEYGRTDLSLVPDFAKYPELVWLDRHPYTPAVLAGFAVWLLAGWSGLVVGFLWSTVALWHATFAINSLAHIVGHRRYETGDQSRNNWWLAILTFGEGWHNNHHHYQSAARQGFRWHEIDVTFCLLKALKVVGLVWDLHGPPASVVRGEQRLGRAVVERAARQLAASFQVEQIAAELHGLLVDKRASLNASLDALNDELAGVIDGWRQRVDERVETTRNKLHEALRAVHLPAIPTMAQLRARADAMFVLTPSMNDIVERGRQKLLDDVCAELLRRRMAAVAATA